MYIKSIDREAKTLIDLNDVTWSFYYLPENETSFFLEDLAKHEGVSDVKHLDAWSKGTSTNRTAYYDVVTYNRRDEQTMLLIREGGNGIESTWLDVMMTSPPQINMERGDVQNLLDIVSHL